MIAPETSEANLMKDVPRLDHNDSKSRQPTKPGLIMECSKCSFSCSVKQEILMHYKIEHFNDRSKPKFVTCRHCSYKSDCQRRLEFHQLFCDLLKSGKAAPTDSTDQLTYHQCDLCNFRTLYKGKLRSHVFNKHNEESIEQSGNAVGVSMEKNDSLGPASAGEGAQDDSSQEYSDAAVNSPGSKTDEEMDSSTTSAADSGFGDPDEDGQTKETNEPDETVKNFLCMKCTEPFESLVKLSSHAVQCQSTIRIRKTKKRANKKKTPVVNPRMTRAVTKRTSDQKIETASVEGPQSEPRPVGQQVVSCSICNLQFRKVIELSKHFVSCRQQRIHK